MLQELKYSFLVWPLQRLAKALIFPKSLSFLYEDQGYTTCRDVLHGSMKNQTQVVSMRFPSWNSRILVFGACLWVGPMEQQWQQYHHLETRRSSPKHNICWIKQMKNKKKKKICSERKILITILGLDSIKSPRLIDIKLWVQVWKVTNKMWHHKFTFFSSTFGGAGSW